MSVNIINQTYSTYGFAWYDWTSAIAEAFYGVDGDETPIILYETGCWDAANNALDCDAVCQRPDQLWNATDTSVTYTIHNCVTYPVISSLWRSGMLTNDAVAIAERYGMQMDPSSTITNLTLFETCIKDFCDRPDLRTEDCDVMETAFETSYPNGTVLFQADYNFNVSICDGLKAEINSDVGGIGVFISYMMQVGLSFLVWLIFHVTGDWHNYVRSFRKKQRTSRGMADGDGEPTHTDEPQSLSRLDFLDALKDFHVTQVFFMMAVQIATLIAINDAGSLDSNSWQQFWDNVGILYDLAFGGCLPLLIIQLLLRQTNDDDYRGWYTLVMTSVSVILAAATWFKTYDFLQMGNPDKLLKYITSEGGPPSCGGVSPTKYCYAGDWYFYNTIASKKAVPMLAFCLIVVVIMWIDQLRVFGQKQKGKSWKKLEYEGSNMFQVLNSTIASRNLAWANRKLLLVIERLIVFLTELTLLGLTILLLLDYVKIFSTNYGFTLLDRSEWSFGQVVAVTIWFPVICKWLWNLAETLMGVSQRGTTKVEKAAEKSRRSTGFSAGELGMASPPEIEREMGHTNKTPHTYAQVARTDSGPYA